MHIYINIFDGRGVSTKILLNFKDLFTAIHTTSYKSRAIKGLVEWIYYWNPHQIVMYKVKLVAG